MWLFKPKKDEDYAKVLETLEEELIQNKTHLVELKQRKRTFNTTWVVYSGVAWAVFTAGFWYYGSSRSMSSAKYTTCMSLSILGPLLVFYSNSLLSSAFNFFIKRTEIKIKSLDQLQKEKIKELKDKTKFDKTRKLIEKYEPSNKKVDGAQINLNQARPVKNIKQPTHPSMSPRSVNVASNAEKIKRGPTGVVEISKPINTKSNVWLENFVDKIVGVDEFEDNRYALICSRCYSHNGLIQKEEIYTVQYICPKCGFFNKSKNSIFKASSHDTIAETPAAENKQNTESKDLDTDILESNQKKIVQDNKAKESNNIPTSAKNKTKINSNADSIKPALVEKSFSKKNNIDNGTDSATTEIKDIEE
ncbi:hypothetical protein BB561_005017 [Smittium simulii]|uniref:Endoplasmic reticulum junction formation protein lunapark n=1 Tax=Smittium simulii TaxID=133385 RepID=A0A2T9YCQ9_9FUNG|nr:hypothetical protein BB561_005017 [Smittium simulii]